MEEVAPDVALLPLQHQLKMETDERQARAKHCVQFVESNGIRGLCPHKGTHDRRRGAAHKLTDQQPNWFPPIPRKVHPAAVCDGFESTR